MKNPVLYLLLLFLLLGNATCYHGPKKLIIDLSADTTKPLEFMKDLKPIFSKKLSDNKSCFHEIHGDHLYLTSIDDKYIDAKYSNRLFLRKTDFDGNEKWVFIIDQFSKVSLKDILPTDDGVYILFEGYTANIARDCFLKKLDNEGNELWTKNFGMNYGTGHLDIMKLDANGHLLFVLNKNQQSILYRTSSKGTILDQATFSDKSELTISDFEFDQKGNIMVIGHITSYPDKKLMQEAFFYKLDSRFNVLKKKVELFGRVTLPNDIALLESGKFAVKISSDIDFNLPPEKQIVPLYFLLDGDLNISNISQIPSTRVGDRTIFKSISADQVIAFDQVYLNKSSCYVFHTFDGKMNYQKSILIKFNIGIPSASILTNGQVLINKFGEEMIRLNIDFD